MLRSLSCGNRSGLNLIKRFRSEAIRVQEILVVSDEVKRALAQGLPVVALESTIISHGLPYPENLNVALKLEAAVYAEGAVPATIAVIGGTPKVGLSRPDIELLAAPQSRNSVIKASRRDLAFACSRGQNAGTYC